MYKLILITLFLAGTLAGQTLSVASPGNILQVTFTLEDGAPSYQVLRFGREVIRPSRLGFMLKQAPHFDRGFSLVSSDKKSVDETWIQPWGEKKDIRNHYRELRVDLAGSGKPARKMTLVFRVFDDGVGFRYEIPEQPGLNQFEIMDELSEFSFTGDHTAWWIPAYQWNRYEYLYSRTPLSAIDTVHTPLTLETANGLHLSIHEAALTDYASMTLARIDSFRLKADLVPWSDGVKVKTAAPMKTPWRTIQIADNPGDLITAYLILNLNEPNKLGDVSWVKPGKYVGIWWEMHLNTATWGSGEKHGATTENAKRYIDFAAKYGFDGVLVEGWNLGWDGDWIKNGDKFNFLTPYDDFDIKEVTRYAAEKGVRLIGHHETGGGIANYERQMGDAFAMYERLGVKAVKTGYVRHGREIERLDENGQVQLEWHHGQYMVRHYRKAVIEAAKHHIMIDAHEPIKDTGIRRTYPNMMTREGARGQEFNAWGENHGNPPEHTTILPFTRLLGGPMDFTPGIFDLLFEEARPDNRVNTTLTKQLALYVVLYSPLHMAADLPENYEARPEPFQFIRDVPTDWEDTRVLNASIGNYLTVVRKDRNSADWYLGSISDAEGRVLHAPLNFLAPGQTYLAEIYRDGPSGNWQDNPYDVEIVKMLVDNAATLTLRLAAGGGQAIRFTPATEADLERYGSATE
ncbi:MAG: glycoside hydrolase family 97 protein [Calditrichaeota bacterium]|nr:glycoside hydrolase family 97 protein [Calditrichota bacterium]